MRTPWGDPQGKGYTVRHRPLGATLERLFPAEQARIIGLLVEWVTVSSTGANIRLRVVGLASLARDLGAGRPVVLEAAD